MNYFERLARRGLQQPVRRPGAPVADPFETVGEWPLEEPAPHRTLEPPGSLPVDDGPLAVAPQVPLPPLTAETTLVESHVTGPPSIAEARQTVPDSPSPLRAAPPAVTAVRRDPGPTPVSPLPPREPAIAIADRFLERLGVHVPGTVPSEPSPAMAVPPAETPRHRPDEAARKAIGPAAIVPVPPAPPTLAPTPANSYGLDTTAPREPGEAPPAGGSARPAVPPREVVIVERQVVRVESRSPARMGAGAPHIGLGQL